MPLTAQVADIHFGLGHGGFQLGKGVYGRSATQVDVSDVDVAHVGLRYADAMSKRSSMRFTLGLQRLRYHREATSDRDRSLLDLSVCYAYLGLEPTFRPIGKVQGLVLSFPVNFSFRTGAQGTGSYESFYSPDTSYALNNEPVSIGGFNIELQGALAYEVPISEQMGLSLGGFVAYGLFDQAGGSIPYKLYHMGFRVAVYHKHALARFFPEK
ncbi:MAG: hypothetical protein WEC15_06445 [Flavobacteriales bacterium]